MIAQVPGTATSTGRQQAAEAFIAQVGKELPNFLPHRTTPNLVAHWEVLKWELARRLPFQEWYP